MKAIGYYKPLPITSDHSLVDLTLPAPAPGPHDLLVRVQAISVNPVDAKVRAGVTPQTVRPRFSAGTRQALSRPSAPR